MGRKSKYKTEEERKEALREYNRQWHIKNRERINERKVKHYHDNKPRYRQKKKEFNKRVKEVYHAFKNNLQPDTNLISNSLETRIQALEAEQRDILATLEEVLQDNRQMKDYIKYGKKPKWGMV